MLEYSSASIEEVIQFLDSSPQGLKGSEATRRLQKHGKNQLEEKKTSRFKIFARQFANPLIYVLFAASLVSLAISRIHDFFVINAIVAINGILGFIQEWKAENSIEALKKLTESCNEVMRDGKPVSVPSSELVPGDYAILYEGELVTADIRLLDSHGLMVDESAITGESAPVVKHHGAKVKKGALPYELENVLLTGTTIVRGTGHGIVIHTGPNTYLASIAKAAQDPSPDPPLIASLKVYAKRYIVMVLCLICFMGLVGYLQHRSLVDLAYLLIAEIVSSIPEGLPIVITLVLTIGALTLSRNKALIRSLPAAETLGSVTVIASDKTGTITEGKLEVKEVFAKDGDELKAISALCNDAHGKKGDPIDLALSRWVGNYEQARRLCPRIWSYPFDAKLMLMATANEVNGKRRIYVKGAFESLKKLADGKQDFKEIETACHALLDKGLRVLAFGSGEWRGEETESKQWDIRLVGLIGFMDLPKRGVAEAVASAKRAGIHVIMLTGDHPKTAQAVARQIGIATNGGYLTGKEIEELSEQELLGALKETTVLARILPEHKYRVVKALQSGAERVAVTGDGVNDVPALKAADIGIAMGSGTGAAKAVSDMVILDNNLKVIVNAIRNARVIRDNIRKATQYLGATSLSEVVFIALVIFTGYSLPITAIQILWINIVTGGVVDKVFAFTKEEGDVMARKPRRSGNHFIDLSQGIRMALFSVGMGTFAFFLYIHLLEVYSSPAVISSIVFCTLVFIQWAHGIQEQKETEPFFKNVWESIRINPYIFLSLGVGVALQCVPIYVFPEFFYSTPLSISDWIYPGIAFIASFLFLELRKWGERWIFEKP